MRPLGSRYGGHITDNIDRRLESTYLIEYLRPEMLDQDVNLAPGFVGPPSLDFVEYHAYIDDELPPETPYLYGLHPNAEIEYLTVTSARLFAEVLAMQDTAGSSDSGGASKQTIISETLEDFSEKLPEGFNMHELQGRVPPEERTPYVPPLAARLADGSAFSSVFGCTSLGALLYCEQV